MGFSYGYNRAERLEHYRSSRELLIMLADLASRGGNFLLDIGPSADGTIPIVMEERLIQIGDWLKINGEAIYGTKPWETTQQWSAGEVPKIEYNKQFEEAYDVMALVDRPAPGQAHVEAFFTAGGGSVFAILPRWPGRSFQVRGMTGVMSVTLLGLPAPLKFKRTKGGVTVRMPELPEALMRQPAWVLRLRR
jgi:alpha-L-fucosidase